MRYILIAFLIALSSTVSAALPLVTRFNMGMDNGTVLTVDNVSKMTQLEVMNLVLAADRSTQSGCPFYAPKKGLFRTGDRVFVSDYYIAWFDYTFDDGVGGHRWSRSGALAGFWTLDPNKKFFKYTLESYSPSRDYPNAEGTCWNWARNELIPGSNSPKGQLYWWDMYAPPLENTIVFKLPQSSGSGTYSDINLFSTVYGGSRGSDGWQNTVGVHYSTAGLLTSWRGDTTFRAANPKNLNQISEGQIDYVLDFVCKEKEIQVVWVFKSSATVIPVNYFMDLWSAYSGLKSSTCESVSQATPVTGYHSYNYGRSSLPFGVIDKLGKIAPFAANTIAAFPWYQSIPCTGINTGIVTNKIAAGLPIGATSELGFLSNLDNLKPYMKLTVRMSPTQGDGTPGSPKALPFQQMVSNYESSDQQQGMLLMSYNSGQVIEAGKSYITSYSISSQK